MAKSSDVKIPSRPFRGNSPTLDPISGSGGRQPFVFTGYSGANRTTSAECIPRTVSGHGAHPGMPYPAWPHPVRPAGRNDLSGRRAARARRQTHDVRRRDHPRTRRVQGIPRKNLVDICGKPLLAWSILQARNAAKSTQSGSPLTTTKSWRSPRGARCARDPPPARDFGRQRDIRGRLSRARRDRGTGRGATSSSPCRRRRRAKRPTSTEEYARCASRAMIFALGHRVEDFFTWRIGADSGAESSELRLPQSEAPTADREALPRKAGRSSSAPNNFFCDAKPPRGRIRLFAMSRFKMFQIDNPEDIDLCTRDHARVPGWIRHENRRRAFQPQAAVDALRGSIIAVILYHHPFGSGPTTWGSME